MAKFHLGWFTNARPHGWGVHGPIPWSGHDSDPSVWQSGDFLVDLVRALERGGFDYLMLEDHSVVADTYRHSMEVDLRHAIRGNQAKLGALAGGNSLCRLVPPIHYEVCRLWNIIVRRS